MHWEAGPYLRLAGQACPRPLELDGSCLQVSPQLLVSQHRQGLDSPSSACRLGCLHVGDPSPPPPCSSPMDGTVPLPHPSFVAFNPPAGSNTGEPGI